MRGTLLVVVAAVCGALAYYGVSKILDGEGGSGEPSGTNPSLAEGRAAAGAPGARANPEAPLPVEGSSTAPGATGKSGRPAPGPTLARSIFYSGDPDADLSPSRGEEPRRPVPEKRTVGGITSGPVPTETGPVERGPAEAATLRSTTPAPASIAEEIEDDRRVARAAIEVGDRERGIRMLRQLYAVYKDNAGVDLSPEVATLLEDEKEGERRLEYASYLSERDRSGEIFERQLTACVKKLAVADTSPDAAYDAWDALSFAYELAKTRSQSEKVLDLLDPFIDRMVFSGRFTPLLTSYTVKAGDNLSTIAEKFQTTSASISRISKLASDTIQPRQRLRVLPGEVSIVVDKSDFVLALKVGGRLLGEFPVGLGRDNSTPQGRFVIAVRQKDPTWWRPGQPPLPPGHPENILGTRWLGFKDTSELAGFGIHGTNEPTELGKESSAGCVRMRKGDVELLYDFAGYGTPVAIRP